MKEQQTMIIYNVFPLLAGPFSKWEPHLQRAASMGFNWIFVNPIQLPGESGSLYSISDYFSINPLLVDEESEKAPEEQVKEMTATARKLGFRVMVDLVINHCAHDSELLKEHPEWFMWEHGHVVHPSCDENGQRVVWGDLAKFNHRHSSERDGMVEFFFKGIKYLLDLGFDGFRCDAAYQIPRDIWERLIRKTRKINPDTMFFAETLGCTAERTRRTSEAGFDYIFNSSKWWDFYSPWLMEQYDLTREIAPSISFPESHDTIRLFDELNGNKRGMKQRYLFAALFSSGVMMPMGFEYGFRKKPHVVKTRPHDWEKPNIDLTEFIKKVNEIKNTYKIFQQEAPTRIYHSDNPNILLVWKGSLKTKDEALIILNKDIWSSQHFYSHNLQDYVQSREELKDVSVEYPVNYIPQPFVYDLNPGQGLIMVTQIIEKDEEEYEEGKEIKASLESAEKTAVK
jgi:starch synthase (maltosyl-transferring)